MPNVAINFDGSSSGGNPNFGGTFFGAYKHTYGPKRIEPIVQKNRPLLKFLKKIDDFEGDAYIHTIAYEDPDTGSTDFATALANANTSSKTARFSIWRGREYQAINISAEEIRASRSDFGSLLRKKDYETRRVLDRMGYRIDVALHGNGTGALATFTTGGSVATPTLTLDIPAMHVRLAVGMNVQIAATTTVLNDGTAPTLIGGPPATTWQIIGIRRSTNPAIPSQVTLNANLTGLSTTTNYTLIRAGDGVGFGMNLLTGGVCGLKAWLPAPPPVGTAFTTRFPGGTDNFWGLNRTVDETKLAGCVYQAQPGEKYQVSFQNAGQELYVNGGGNEDPNMLLLVHPVDYTGYSLELGPQVRYGDVDEASSGFKALKVRTQAGDMSLVADPQVEPGLFYMLDRDALHIKTLDSIPHVDQQDGLTGLRLSGSDGQQIRWRAWYQLVVTEPGRCLVGRIV